MENNSLIPESLEQFLLTSEELATLYFENDTILEHTPKNKEAWLKNIKKYRHETLNAVLQTQLDKVSPIISELKAEIANLNTQCNHYLDVGSELETEIARLKKDNEGLKKELGR